MRIALLINCCVFFASAATFSALLAEVEPTITIPLSDVMGLGQRGLRELEPDLLIYRDTPEKIEKYSTPEGMEEARRLAAKSLVVPIEQAMDSRKAEGGGNAGKGFAVPGRGRDALPGVYDVFVNGKQPSNTFDANSEISVLFFSLKYGAAVRIDSITRTGGVVTIHYMMSPNSLRVQNWQLALIPLGKLPPGAYRVQTVRVEPEEDKNIKPGAPAIRKGAEKGVVCESFDFEVRSNN